MSTIIGGSKAAHTEAKNPVKIGNSVVSDRNKNLVHTAGHSNTHNTVVTTIRGSHVDEDVKTRTQVIEQSTDSQPLIETKQSEPETMSLVTANKPDNNETAHIETKQETKQMVEQIAELKTQPQPAPAIDQATTEQAAFTTFSPDLIKLKESKIFNSDAGQVDVDTKSVNTSEAPDYNLGFAVPSKDNESTKLNTNKYEAKTTTTDFGSNTEDLLDESANKYHGTISNSISKKNKRGVKVSKPNFKMDAKAVKRHLPFYALVSSLLVLFVASASLLSWVYVNNKVETEKARVEAENFVQTETLEETFTDLNLTGGKFTPASKSRVNSSNTIDSNWLRQNYIGYDGALDDSDNCIQETVCGNTTDTDGDNLNTIQEYNFGTDPNSNDTDKDGLSDGDELLVYNTSATSTDSDEDSFGDAEEIVICANPVFANLDYSDSDLSKLSENVSINQLTAPTIETLKAKGATDEDVTTLGYIEAECITEEEASKPELLSEDE